MNQTRGVRLQGTKSIEATSRRPWAFVLAALGCGSALGLGSFAFHFAEGTSYFSSASESCANCHIMREQYDAWAKSSHGRFAVCNDCHSPHDVLGKWYCKTRNGYFHSVAFTTQRFDEPIMIGDYNRRVVEQNCRHCHADFVHAIDTLTPRTGDRRDDGDRMECIRCHAGVGHPL